MSLKNWTKMTNFLAASAMLALTGCQNGDAQTEANTPVAYDAVPPHITKWMQQPAILVFSKTNGWRHNEGIAGADKFFVDFVFRRWHTDF